MNDIFRKSFQASTIDTAEMPRFIQIFLKFFVSTLPFHICFLKNVSPMVKFQFGSVNLIYYSIVQYNYLFILYSYSYKLLILCYTRQRLGSRQFKQHQDASIPISIVEQNGIERWINDILKEACLNEKQISLSKLGLDRNSLKSAGVKDEDVGRLYRSMFVYTVGFYEMLHEILKNLQLTASIWKVFGILLEYVAKGDFYFTINQIQQESQQKIEELNQTLVQRETQFKVIENQAKEEINKLQNMLQDTTDQNYVLKLQRDNAEIDFHQSNTAFEEEVALRIKFEYRINQIIVETISNFYFTFKTILI